MISSYGMHNMVVFNIVNGMGPFFTCCGMSHNDESQALGNLEEVEVYSGTGRAPTGSVKGMLYALQDEFVVPVGKQDFLPPRKTEKLITS